MAYERPKPVVLMVLDGWGVAPVTDGNAIGLARKPVMDRLVSEYPAMNISASGAEVGLSWGEMGNSEVGHLNIGAGRVYYQTLPRIAKSIEDGSFAKNEALGQVLGHVKSTRGALHLVGLVSRGNVHSSLDHLFALLTAAKAAGQEKVFVHAILDGRDTVFNAGMDFMKELDAKMKELRVGRIASLSGRYYAMDRDNRWDRTEKAFRAIALGQSDSVAEDPLQAISDSYERKVYDEEFVPTVVVSKDKPIGPLAEGDGMFFFNFRPDRMRQIVQAFAVPNFSKFERTVPGNLSIATMTEYEKDLPVLVAYPPEVIRTCLAKVISDAGLRQLHIAETEKYAHVTFFLNGTIEEPMPGEDRVIIPSPRVPSYDKKPEMSAREIAARVVKEIGEDKYDFIAMNFANADMVAHTGDLKASIAGVEAVDESVGKIVDAALAKGGAVVITADHGNGEELSNLQTGEMDKEHSTNPVPFIVIGKAWEGQQNPMLAAVGGDMSLMPPVGMLADVAPTILSIMGLDQPGEMTGRPLL